MVETATETVYIMNKGSGGAPTAKQFENSYDFDSER